MGARTSLAMLLFTCAAICAAGSAAAQGAQPVAGPPGTGPAAAKPAPARPARAPVETIVMAAEDDWPPYSYARAGSAGPEGISPVLVAAAFETQGVRVKFVVVPFARCLLMAQTGAAVGCFNVTITDENRDQFYWNTTPLFQEELVLFARADAPDREVTLDELEGHALGITAGYTYPSSITANPRIYKIPVSSDANLLSMLVAGRVDYILLYALPGYYRASLDPKLAGRFKAVRVVGLESIWISFSRKHPEGKRFSEVFETGLQAIKANGTYAKVTADFRRRLNLPAR